ncbi:MAG: hypothetical protein KU37_11695 [Sulfuricurvum sp. PC08-66]|nr:MAG: hypothetical protein KU37_11695 [Sulfuricurvum sp. PC08-66]
MLKIKKAFVILFLSALVLYAKSDINSTEKTKFNGAISAGYSSYHTGLFGLAEYKFQKNIGAIANMSMYITNSDISFERLDYGLDCVYYFKEDNFLYEGVYISYLVDIQQYFLPTKNTIMLTGVSSGYGWHFFDHSLLLSFGIGLVYKTGNIWDVPYRGNLSYIF